MKKQTKNRKQKPAIILSYLSLRVRLYEGYHSFSMRIAATKKQKLLKQKLELMACREDVQAEIKSFREEFSVPLEGFSSFNDGFEWSQNVARSYDPKSYPASGPVNASREQGDNLQTFSNSPLEAQYKRKLTEFLRLFEIDDRWSDAVEYYILFNKIDAHEVLPKSVKIQTIPDKDGRQSLQLLIRDDVEQSDVLAEWPVIEAWQGIVHSQQNLNFNDPAKKLWKELEKIDPNPDWERQKKRKNRGSRTATFESYMLAYRLKREGKSYKEIAKELGFGADWAKAGIHVKRSKDLIYGIRLD